MIADHELGCNHTMCSFDVKNLFTILPVDITENFILDTVFADKESKFHCLNRTELQKCLIRLVKILFCNSTKNIIHR